MDTNRKQTIKSFTDLVAYQKAHDLALHVYAITKAFPQEEKFALVNQMRRCAVSITSNIAEGFGRSTAKDKLQFYAISKGSLYELESQFLIARDLGFLTDKEWNNFEEKLQTSLLLLSGLMKSAMSR